jgi:predicted nucleic acid-binding protein
MPKERIYIETSIISYLTARGSRSLIAAAHQQITREWWDDQRKNYDICASILVRDECAAGDGDAASKRLEMLSEIKLLDITEQAEEIALELIASKIIPTKAADDAAHIAIATVHGMDYLLTWNCKHIANPHILSRIEMFPKSYKYISHNCYS